MYILVLTRVDALWYFYGMTRIRTVGENRPYILLAEALRDKIVRGDVGADGFLGTEVELSRQHKLARMTVRRAVQMLVDEGLIERFPGRGLFVRDAKRRTRAVRFMAGNLYWAPIVQMSRGAREVAMRTGVELQLYDAHGDVEDDLAAIRRLPESGARGAIIVSLHSPRFNNELCGLIAKNFPFVVVDQQLSEIDAPSVCSDNILGGSLIARELMKAGHTRVSFIGDIDVSTTYARLIGLSEALADSGVRLMDALDITPEDRLGDWSACVSDAVRKIMAKPERPTALVCSCDSVARSAYRALAAAGVRIPEDVSIVGFDDDPMSEWLSPPLSTVHQCFEDVGKAAMELLLERMVNPARPAERRVVPVHYVARDSVCALRRHEYKLAAK